LRPQLLAVYAKISLKQAILGSNFRNYAKTSCDGRSCERVERLILAESTSIA